MLALPGRCILGMRDESFGEADMSNMCQSSDTCGELTDHTDTCMVYVALRRLFTEVYYSEYSIYLL